MIFVQACLGLKSIVMMRGIITSVLILITLITGSAQCDFHSDEIDPFTKQRTLATKWHKLNYPGFGAKKVSALISRVDAELDISVYFIAMHFERMDELVCVSANSKLYFLFNDDSVLQLEPTNFKCADRFGSYYNGFYYFRIDEQDLIVAADNELKSIKLIHTDGNIIIGITGKDPIKEIGKSFFSKNVPCILK